MTAARRLPRCRGARAVANFNAAERHGATNQIQRIPVGQLSGSANAAHGFCLAVGSAALFNGRNAQVDAPATAVPVLCSRHTREIDARPSTMTREFVAGVKTLSGLADRIERIANRAVRR